MEITDKLLIELNNFRNQIIFELYNDSVTDSKSLFKTFNEYYNDLKIELLKEPSDRERVIRLTSQLGSVLYLINYKMRIEIEELNKKDK